MSTSMYMKSMTAAPTPTQARAAKPALVPSAAIPDRGLSASLLALQRTVGNRATAALIRSRDVTREPELRAGERKLAHCAGRCTGPG